MVLVDTSVWVDHLRSGDAALARHLDRNEVLTHPFVIGELALGNLVQRDLILSSLNDLPSAVVSENAEVMTFIETASLFGLGIGFVDAHLLASAKLTAGASLWTRDRRLLGAAQRLGLTVAEGAV
jgi:predicted nucleic acid-binding protein